MTTYDMGPLDTLVGFHFPQPKKKDGKNKLGFILFYADLTPAHEYNSYFGIQERWSGQDLMVTFVGSPGGNRRADPNDMDNSNDSAVTGIGALPTSAEYAKHNSMGTAFGTQTSGAVNLSTGYWLNIQNIVKAAESPDSINFYLFPTIFEVGRTLTTNIKCRFRVWEGEVTAANPGIFADFKHDPVTGLLLGVPTGKPIVDVSATGPLQSRTSSVYPGSTIPWVLNYDLQKTAHLTPT
jgi:hypothetical protein